jgi:hypothetical protein
LRFSTFGSLVPTQGEDARRLSATADLKMADSTG